MVFQRLAKQRFADRNKDRIPGRFCNLGCRRKSALMKALVYHWPRQRLQRLTQPHDIFVRGLSRRLVYHAVLKENAGLSQILKGVLAGGQYQLCSQIDMLDDRLGRQLQNLGALPMGD